jgi:hypothetical protein
MFLEKNRSWFALASLDAGAGAFSALSEEIQALSVARHPHL